MTQLTLESVAPVRGDGRLHGVRRDRGRAHRGADGGAAPPDGVGEVVGHRPGRRSSPRRRSRSSCRTSTSRSCSAASTRPAVGVVDSLRAGTLMRERGIESGGLTVFANTEVHRHGRRGRPDPARAHLAGTIEAEVVVIACGVWSPLLAEMAGAHIPLTPMVHQMIDVGPVPRFERTSKAIEYPIVRDMDVFMYERQDGVEPRDRLVRAPLDPPRPRGDPVDRGGRALARPSSRSRRPTSTSRCEHALDLMPEIVGDESVGVKYAINGLISLTPDGMPILGETPEVEGPLVGGRRLGQGRARASASRSPSGWCTASRTSTCTPPTSSRFHDAPEDARARQGAHRRGVPEDLRDRPPGRAVGVRPRAPALADARARARRSARSSTRSPAGSGRSGTRRTRRSSSATASSRARPSGTRAGGRRSSTPSTSRCASTPGSSTSRRSRSSTSQGAGALDALQRRGARADGRAGRPRRLHAGARPGRRLQVRPDDHAARRRAVPHRHRRRARHGRPQAVPRPAARATARRRSST